MSQLREIQLLQKIAVVLKELREQDGVTQETVFGETGIHIGRIETARANVTVSTLSKLCDHFGISLSEFFEKVERLGGR